MLFSSLLCVCPCDQHGRTAVFEFRPDALQLHERRTHFAREQAFLCLVVSERGTYYNLVSWRGDSSKRRALALVEELAARIDAVVGRGPLARGALIVSRDEVRVVKPFAARLRGLAAQGVGALPLYGVDRESLCYENLPAVINVDRFFHQFAVDKHL